MSNEDEAWVDWQGLNAPRGARVFQAQPGRPVWVDPRFAETVDELFAEPRPVGEPKLDGRNSEAWTEPRYIKRACPPAECAVSPLPESALAIAAECDRIKATLVEKNLAYGNSALDPVRIFSDADGDEQLRVRIDDKLSRLQRGGAYGDEDTILDLIGYLILLRIATKEAGK